MNHSNLFVCLELKWQSKESLGSITALLRMDQEVTKRFNCYCVHGTPPTNKESLGSIISLLRMDQEVTKRLNCIVYKHTVVGSNRILSLTELS